MDASISEHATDAETLNEVLDKMSGGVVLFLNTEHNGDYLQVRPDLCLSKVDLTFFSQPKEDTDRTALRGEIEADTFDALVERISRSTKWSMSVRDKSTA